MKFSIHTKFNYFDTNTNQWHILLLMHHHLFFKSNLTNFILFVVDYGRLMLVAESLTTLLFPFMWPHVYVPILPAAMHSFLDAPVPYLMGLRLMSNDDSRIPSEVNFLHFLSAFESVPILQSAQSSQKSSFSVGKYLHSQHRRWFYQRARRSSVFPSARRVS